MKVKTIVAWVVKATVMVAAPGGLMLAGYEAWKWWKHRHDQQKPQLAKKNKAEEAKENEAEEAKENEEVSEEKVN